jgi:hypothetical protein
LSAGTRIIHTPPLTLFSSDSGNLSLSGNLPRFGAGEPASLRFSPLASLSVSEKLAMDLILNG